jgi:hypothetical protein
MSVSVDEREHSLEMHLPYIVQVMGQRQYTLVPIMVGAINEAAEQRFGRLLAPYLADPENLFVISSDFCHWGERFGFSYHDPCHGGEIYQSVEALDRKGMVCIECQDPNAYADYQREFNNTICGRHPIAVLLNALSALKENNNNNNGGQQQHWQSQLKFVRYEQSSQARRPEDSSVSYASAVVWEGTCCCLGQRKRNFAPLSQNGAKGRRRRQDLNEFGSRRQTFGATAFVLGRSRASCSSPASRPPQLDPPRFAQMERRRSQRAPTAMPAEPIAESSGYV